METIFALATGAGRAAVAVVRLSGPQAGPVVRRIAGSVPPPRRAVLRRLRDPRTDDLIDDGLVLWFPAPRSFTGEDAAELQIHGGRAVVAALLRVLGEQPGCRLAQVGEFTRRALLNDRLDLPAVEGLADLIDAQTEAQRRQAQRQREGVLGAWIATQREALLEAMATAESAIDFADEGDVAGDFARELQGKVQSLVTAIDREIEQARAAERIRDGLVVALAGPANAGKSTLLNRLARREVAIVSAIPGTTRDPIEVDLDLNGMMVRVIDTAGLRASDDPIEQAGMSRTRDRVRTADLVLWLTDACDPVPPDAALPQTPLWRIATKVDLAARVPVDFDHAISAIDGTGCEGLLQALQCHAQEGVVDGEGVVTRERHRLALMQAKGALDVILQAGADGDLEIAAEQLKAAARHLDSVIGRLQAEDVLGAVFARFCIGK